MLSLLVLVSILSLLCQGEKNSLNGRVIPISDCGELTESGATYVLQNNATALFPFANSYCFLISSPSITLDGNGYFVIQPLADLLDESFSCITVDSANAIVQNIQLQCNIGLSVTTAGTGTFAFNLQISIGYTGISILGDYVTVTDCVINSIVGSSAVGIEVGAVRGANITQNHVSGCTGSPGLLADGADAEGISISGAQDSILQLNEIFNILGGDATALDTAGGGSAVGIFVENSRNVSILGNSIAYITGGGVIIAGLGGPGGSAYGIQASYSSVAISGNSILYISGGEGGAGVTSGDGGCAEGIHAEAIYISSINGNNIVYITGGDGADANVLLGGVGGNACGINITEADCLGYNTNFPNQIVYVTAGNGGSPTLNIFSPVNGVATNTNLPSNILCQITDLKVEAPTGTYSGLEIEISVTVLIYGFVVENFMQSCHFESNDPSAPMPASQAIPSSSGVFTFSTIFFLPQVSTVTVNCNGTQQQVSIQVSGCGDEICNSESGESCKTCVLDCGACPTSGPDKPPPVTFTRYGRNYIVVNWHLDNDTNYDKCQIFFSADQNLWSNITVNANTSSYTVSNLELSTTYYFYITLSAQNGVSPPSDIANFTTSAAYCGDTICDKNETCSSCYFDCESSCEIPTCRYACFGNSTCVDGTCQCTADMYGPDCSSPKTSRISIAIKTQNFPSFAISQISSEIQFLFYVLSREIYEIDVSGNIVSPVFSFDKQVYKSSEKSISPTLSQKELVFTLPNNATVTLTCKLSNISYTASFAGTSFLVHPNVLKLWITIENWAFENIGNSLVLTLDTTSDDNSTKNDTWADSGNNLLWSEQYSTNASLYATYNENALIDNGAKKVKFSLGSDTLVHLQIPHFWDSAVIDPCYAVLLEPSYNPESSGGNGGVKNSSNSVSPAVIVPIVIIVFIAALAAIAVKWVLSRREKAKRRSEKENLRSKLEAHSQSLAGAYTLATPATAVEVPLEPVV